MPATIAAAPDKTLQARPASCAREILEGCGVDPDVILAERARLRAST